MASKAVNAARAATAYGRAMAQRHQRMLQERLTDASLSGRLLRACTANSYSRKVGLLDDDQLYAVYRPHVAEGISRLPREEQELRVFRNLQAAHLDARAELLPEQEWVTEESNLPYAQAYVDDAVDELHAKMYWEHQ